MEQVWNSATLMQCQRGHEYKPLLPPGRGLPPPPFSPPARVPSRLAAPSSPLIPPVIVFLASTCLFSSTAPGSLLLLPCLPVAL